MIQSDSVPSRLGLDKFEHLNFQPIRIIDCAEQPHDFQFRSEFVNNFNRTNFNAVDTTYGDSVFGQVYGSDHPQIVEFALRWQF